MAERGFSFAQDGPLDMRMGPSAGSSAEEIINTWSEADLGRIFREYGEERAWRRIAQKIVEVCGLSLTAFSWLWACSMLHRSSSVCSRCCL